MPYPPVVATSAFFCDRLDQVAWYKCSIVCELSGAFLRHHPKLRIVCAFVVCFCAAAVALSRQTDAGSHPAQVQTGPVTEPRNAAQEPGAHPVVKGAEAIHEREAKCTKTLVVYGDALFKPGRWTLNPDGGETLSELAPLITKAGKHPMRIEAFSASGVSSAENESVAERRASTVRGWLRNHGYIAENTPIRGFAAAPASPAPKNGQSTAPEEHVDVVIDTCK